MKYKFLRKLLKFDLDNRTSEEIRQECIRRIRRYCPEWDFSPSDAGMAIIGLFAYLVSELLESFNQVPLKMYITFLELLGIDRAPATAAETLITFYLTTERPSVYTIPAGEGVKTKDVKDREPVTFTTDEDLEIGKPILGHFLTASIAEDLPQTLSDRTDNWQRLGETAWRGNEQLLFGERPEAGNCFYLVLNSRGLLNGNVLAIAFDGAKGAPTGINPYVPPRRWEAFDGEYWQPILLKESDDETRGFSFETTARDGGNPEQGAKVVLHLPQNFPVTTFTAYQGHWLRCVLIDSQTHQSVYSRSPRITGLKVRSIGGTVRASHSITIREEELGNSNGEPGQRFELYSKPVLARREGEQIEVTLPTGQIQIWQEVPDFADSSVEDLHYTIDSLAGIVQFGPRILEPSALKVQTASDRSNGVSGFAEGFLSDRVEQKPLQYQYGAVPPRGSKIKMVAYRIGGGEKGNVEAGMLQHLTSSISYVDSNKVTNHYRAYGGEDAESLEQAIFRVPQMLRTRDRAVTAEDYEVLTHRAGGKAVYRVKCPSSPQSPGRITIFVVPQVDTDPIALEAGIPPERLALSPRLERQIMQYLDERRPLGVPVQLQTPEYVGVTVHAKVAIEPAHNNAIARPDILKRMRIALYRYLNPLTGGTEGTGWPFGQVVHDTDLGSVLRNIEGVSYVEAVYLFALRPQGETWKRDTIPEPSIDPGPLGLICSWGGELQDSRHHISIIN